VTSSSIQRFVERAESFRRFMEEASSLSLPDRLRRAQAELLALYQAALDLPDVEPGEEAEGATASVTDWPGMGEVDGYWEVFDPYEQPSVTT
jgi:hypothetical protein